MCASVRRTPSTKQRRDGRPLVCGSVDAECTSILDHAALDCVCFAFPSAKARTVGHVEGFDSDEGGGIRDSHVHEGVELKHRHRHAFKTITNKASMGAHTPPYRHPAGLQYSRPTPRGHLS